MPITQSDVINWFTYHPPTDAQAKDYEAIRNAARTFGMLLLVVLPESADKSAAFRLLRECVMTANAAIACQEKPPDGNPVE